MFRVSIISIAFLWLVVAVNGSPIRHIVAVMLENRPFDHFFGYFNPCSFCIKFTAFTA